MTRAQLVFTMEETGSYLSDSSSSFTSEGSTPYSSLENLSEELVGYITVPIMTSICRICHLEFPNKNTLNWHSMDYHNAPMVMCNCGRIFNCTQPLPPDNGRHTRTCGIVSYIICVITLCANRLGNLMLHWYLNVSLSLERSEEFAGVLFVWLMKYQIMSLPHTVFDTT